MCVFNRLVIKKQLPQTLKNLIKSVSLSEVDLPLVLRRGRREKSTVQPAGARTAMMVLVGSDINHVALHTI